MVGASGRRSTAEVSSARADIAWTCGTGRPMTDDVMTTPQRRSTPLGADSVRRSHPQRIGWLNAHPGSVVVVANGFRMNGFSSSSDGVVVVVVDSVVVVLVDLVVRDVVVDVEVALVVDAE